MVVRIYLRASTKDQDVNRAEAQLKQLISTTSPDLQMLTYREHESGTKLDRPVLKQLMNESAPNDVLLVESVDRLSRLNASDFDQLKSTIKAKGLHLVVADLPTTHQVLTGDTKDTMQSQLMQCVSNMLIDLMATMARIDNDKRIERIKQGIDNKKSTGWKPQGKQHNQALHDKIKALLVENRLTKQEIAMKLSCGVATVYRVAKI
jgi:DNA invertase Pin-like site-specific DNA recombinase